MQRRRHVDIFQETKENDKIYNRLHKEAGHRQWALTELTFLAERAEWQGNLTLCLACLEKHRHLLYAMSELFMHLCAHHLGIEALIEWKEWWLGGGGGTGASTLQGGKLYRSKSAQV